MTFTAVSRRLSKAAQLLSEEQYPTAVILYESILRDEPDHVDALNDAAVAYRKINRYHITEDYLRRALQIDPAHQNAFYNLVELLRGLRQPVEAALVFDQFQDRIPTSRQKAALEHALWPRRPPAPPLLDQDDRANGDALATMWDHWGNKQWSANPGFAKQMVELAAATDRPILECGSGYTTFLLGHLASQCDVEVWTLEHNEKWHAYVTRALERADLHRVNVCLTPLRDYGDFDWYDVTALDLPDAFGLVVCDGPPGKTRGGRSGFFPVMRQRLAADCTILLDDVQREDEMELAQSWAESGKFSLALTDTDNKQFAILSRSDTAPEDAAPAPPTPGDNAYPPLAHAYRSHLAEHPSDARIFFRAINLLLDQGCERNACEVFETYDANVPECPSKQTLRRRLPLSSSPQTTSSDGPICIGGCGSSGTSLLRRLLDMHSQIACGKELSVFDRPRLYDMSIQELRALYTAGEFKTLDEEVLFDIRLEDGGSYVGLRPGNYGDYYHSVPSVLGLFDEAQTVPEFFDLYLSRYAQRQGKSIWAEKTPNNIYCAEQFLSAYPKGRFIQVLRDGRDVCLSLNRRRNFSLHDAVTRWVSAVEAGLRARDHERFYTVRYEDLVYNPEATLTALLEWLELSFEPNMLAFTEKKEASIHGYAEEPIHSESAFRWKQEWNQIDTRLRRFLDLSLHQHLVTTGYEGRTQGDSRGGFTESLPRVTVSTPSERNEVSVPPVFVGGAGRSGTKLVRAILNAHPNIAISHELKITPHLAEAWARTHQMRDHLSEFFDAKTEDIDNFFRDFISYFLNGVRGQNEALRVGEKTPNNALVFPHLNRLFPESPIIHIIRDGRDVVSSLLQKNWEGEDGNIVAINTDPGAAAGYWDWIVRTGRKAAERPSVRDQYLEIRYEELVSNPETVMRRIIAHVGEPWDDCITRFHEFDDPIYPSVQRPISDKSVGNWERSIDDETKRIFKDVAGDLLIELGYAKNKDW